MSQKKHKGDHAKRAERHAAAKRAAANTPTSIDKPRRVYLRNRLYILLTTLVVLGVLALIIVFQFFGFWDSLIGTILFVAVAAFECMCIVDLGLLFSACVAFGEGMVSAGKNDKGVKMVFHAASVVRMELRDTKGNVLPENQAKYKNVDLTFVMESGRANIKHLSRLTAGQLAALKEALEAEQKADCTY